MKNLKTYEGFWGDLARLNPERKENDNKAMLLFHDIVNDFEKYGSDLKKVKIIDDGNSTINFTEFVLGKSYTLSYIFGKYHPVKKDHHSGNRENGDRRIKIINFPFSIVFRKNELEKAFDTDRISSMRAKVKDVRTIPNYDGTKPHQFNEKIDEYTISSDIANQLFEFFKEEFEIQYPDLKSSRYKDSMGIKDIEKNVKPTTKFIEVRGKDGNMLTYSLRLGDNEKEVRRMLSNMTKAEYDVYWKARNKELYEPSYKKDEEYKNEICGKISEILKKYGINLEPLEFNEFGFGRATVNQYEIVVEFKSVDPEIESKVDNAIKTMQNFNGYTFTNKRIMDGYSDKNTKYILLHFEKK